MECITIPDPIYGLPLTVKLFDDGTYAYEHAITHQVVTGKYCCVDKARMQYRFGLNFTAKEFPITIPAADAAERLGVSRMRVTQLCNEGKIRSAMIGSSLFVNLDDVMAYGNSDRTPGRKEQRNA